MADERFVAIAHVVRTHGLKGEISVAPAFEISFESFVGITVWITPPAGSVRSGRITGVRQGPKGPLVSLDSIGSIDSASHLVGKQLLAAAQDLPDNLEGEEEPNLEGYAVYDESRGLLGEIAETLITGANDVWVVHGSYGEVLLPVIDDVVIEIDDDARTVRVKLLEGLMPGEGD